MNNEFIIVIWRPPRCPNIRLLLPVALFFLVALDRAPLVFLMPSSKRSLLLLALLSTATTASSSLVPHRRFVPREYVTVDNIADSYDFVIAGGGTAGLSLATLLSANSNFTVLVIEAGGAGPSSVNIPADTYFESLLGTQYDYAFNTVAQSNAGGRNVPWPRGKILGGSSAVNGMYLVRPSETEVNAWQSLISSQSGAEQWNWENFYAAMKKAEVFTPPTQSAVQTAGIQYTADSHGTSGAVHHSYPGYMVPVTKQWLPTVQAAGIELTSDAYGGKTLGGFFACSAINPSNWTRSYAKSAFLDPLPPRSNLHVLVQNTVTRIVFDNSTSSSSGIRATNVEFASVPGQKSQSVKVGKEVIVSGGTVNSPQILQVSGVGPSEVLGKAGVDVVLELEGVGMHLQDHISAGVVYESKVDTQGDVYNSGSSLSKSSEFLSFINSGVAYVNASTLFGSQDAVTTMHQGISNNMTSFASQIDDSQVAAGFKAIYSATADKIFNSDNALVELLFSINSPGKIAVQAAIQHAFSQGRIGISTGSAFDAPNIDPQYFSNWADVATMRQGLKLARQIAQTPPLNTVLGNEVAPGSDVQTDEDWENWLRNNGGTEFHPVGTCAMMPKEMGGVVDNSLKVYGVENVRVVDASVFPINFAAHTMEPTYGLVEKAAEIIQNAYAPVAAANQSGGGSAANSTDPNVGQSNGSAGTTVRLGWILIATLLLIVLQMP
ncbi:hypothetical protein NP233_g1548 [Leucocoprinus birnbaumii]|uniref:pyranose dehydrogenase (acceptor) n=1 Tax=Leucocoprinus birnbaumii TaxID=56174 RepID=A0AAD5W3X5_9AGAR|nr:hypothetical protein NP233_g1548 [Leucocoprinus birnbaumii]